MDSRVDCRVRLVEDEVGRRVLRTYASFFFLFSFLGVLVLVV